ncbi:tetratricopeptide repeat-containing sulfotransferase family protein [Pseudoalteromonas sp. G4]|uniref:tetratricopeptide repeat-containing sulfotransferase family protein n=1 Tax=Pseudoalteromonas sp. G4 TaxID=2992761 RepID=UPI00237D6217|nr:tetratricopeptide repeat-containing sulfotransferase family protein [Pseudoalteromonas sp. G4]MDE3271881.1 sulfotransferase [Pseudoalteromonas sp. G4]
MTDFSQVKQLLATGGLNKAHALLVAALKKDAAHCEAWSYLAELNLLAGDKVKALNIIKKALSLSPPLSIALHLAKTALHASDFLLCQNILESINSACDNASQLDLSANLWLRLNQPYRALAQFEKAHQLAPDSAAITLNYAICLKMAGDTTTAKALLEKVIDLQPMLSLAHLSLAELSPKSNNTLPSQLTNALSHGPKDQYLNHAKALYHEANADYEKAWTCFNHSKQRNKNQVHFDTLAHQAYCDSIIAASHLPSDLSQLTINNSISPIFIVGMPRSGTSLLEQLLATQKTIKALGELSFIPQLMAVKPGFYKQPKQLFTKAAELILNQYSQCFAKELTSSPAAHAIDKQPFNIYFVDIILALFPNAKIVWLVRDKFDTCIGNFRQAYQVSSPFHHYSYDWQHINHFYDDIVRLGENWCSKYPNQFLRVNYESLVQQPKAQLTAVFQFLNLTQTAEPLDFYKKDYFSATASKVQLRQPLNTHSIGKYKSVYPIKEK